MKIAFVIHDLNRNGGQERSTLEIIDRLVKNHEVHAFASEIQDAPSRLHQHLVPVWARRPLFVKDLSFRRNASAMLARHHFDLVHATGSCVDHADVFTLQFLQSRWELERGKLESPFGARRLYHDLQFRYDLWTERRVLALNRQARFIAISEQVAGDLRRFGNIKDIDLIPHGVNAAEFAADSAVRVRMREQLGVAENEIAVLFVGAFERKGLATTIEALGPLTEQVPLKLIVVGDGPTERMKLLASRVGLHDRALFFGKQRDVAPYYQMSDLFVLPSLYDPFGLVGIEALSCSVPSILSRQSGCSHLIRAGENGFVLEDAADVAEFRSLLARAFRELPALSAGARRLRELTAAESWDAKTRVYEQSFVKAAG